ncbi:MAG: DedA family protein [Syntrophobacterales bacterium]|jgi:membrane protein YqaA with SNARE-associated domain|nr:DedA family protein [Syntrophobacterales bacterium]
MDSLVNLGYLGLFIGSFLASTIVPFSAAAILLGVLVLGGNVYLCLIVATAGNWSGGMVSYFIGWLGRWEWLEKWFKVKRETLEKQKMRIDRWGALLGFFAWLPLVGDGFAIALGFYRVNPLLASMYMLAGRFTHFAVWCWLYVNCAGHLIMWLGL